jgi:hypothetical protein
VGELEHRAAGTRLRVPHANPARAQVGYFDAVAVVRAVRALSPLGELGRLRKVRAIPPVLVKLGGSVLACFIVSGYHCYLAMAYVRRPLPTEGSDWGQTKANGAMRQRRTLENLNGPARGRPFGWMR